ncbi:MAG: efflux RND transporter periplasmic adaptor subunit [Pseudomonadota bacterium]
MKPALALTLSTALVLLIGCGQDAPTPVVPPVKVVSVEALTGANALAYSAEIEAETTLNLAFRTDGYVDSIATRPGVDDQPRLLQTGDTVSKDEVLASIESEEYRDKVETAQANVDKAEAEAYKADQDFRRAEALSATDSITGPDYDSAKSAYESAQAAIKGANARLDQARIKLEDTKLVAPVAATVQQRQIEIGSLVHSNTVGFVLAKIGTVKAVFGLPDHLLELVDIGQVVDLRSTAVPGRAFTGQITEIAAAADARTHLFDVSVSIANEDGALRPGMIAALALSTPGITNTAVGVPLEAIVESSGGGFAVFVVELNQDETTVKLQPISTGQVIGNTVAVLSGLTPGQQIVVKGMAQLRDGQAANIIQ